MVGVAFIAQQQHLAAIGHDHDRVVGYAHSSLSVNEP